MHEWVAVWRQHGAARRRAGCELGSCFDARLGLRPPASPLLPSRAAHPLLADHAARPGFAHASDAVSVQRHTTSTQHVPRPDSVQRHEEIRGSRGAYRRASAHAEHRNCAPFPAQEHPRRGADPRRHVRTRPPRRRLAFQRQTRLLRPARASCAPGQARRRSCKGLESLQLGFGLLWGKVATRPSLALTRARAEMFLALVPKKFYLVRWYTFLVPRAAPRTFFKATVVSRLCAPHISPTTPPINGSPSPHRGPHAARKAAVCLGRNPALELLGGTVPLGDNTTGNMAALLSASPAVGSALGPYYERELQRLELHSACVGAARLLAELCEPCR